MLIEIYSETDVIFGGDNIICKYASVQKRPFTDDLCGELTVDNSILYSDAGRSPLIVYRSMFAIT